MLSVVSPIYNERESVGELVRRLTAALAPLGPYELVLVDDGSADGSWDALCGLAAADERVRLLRLSRNFGHQVALTAGLDAARGDAVVLIDGDLQDPPEVIPELVARWQEGFDVVYAVREQREGESRLRLLAISAYYKAFRRMTATDIPAEHRRLPIAVAPRRRRARTDAGARALSPRHDELDRLTARPASATGATRATPARPSIRSGS